MPDEPQPTLKQMWQERKPGKSSVDIPSYGAWKDSQTPETMRTLVKDLAPTIDSAISAYAGNKASDTVRQRARLLAAKAVRGYDPKFGASLQTHVNRQLQELQRLAPQLSDPLPAPEKFRLHANMITNAARNMEDFLGREPTDEELAEDVGLPIKRVISVRSQQRARLPMSVFEADDDDEGGTDPVASSREPQDDWMDAVYHDLGEPDKLIFMHRTGYRGGQRLSNMDIAQKMGVSPAYVSQRARWIQQRLDEFNG